MGLVVKFDLARGLSLLSERSLHSIMNSLQNECSVVRNAIGQCTTQENWLSTINTIDQESLAELIRCVEKFYFFNSGEGDRFEQLKQNWQRQGRTLSVVEDSSIPKIDQCVDLWCHDPKAFDALFYSLHRNDQSRRWSIRSDYWKSNFFWNAEHTQNLKKSLLDVFLNNNKDRPHVEIVSEELGSTESTIIFDIKSDAIRGRFFNGKITYLTLHPMHHLYVHIDHVRGEVSLHHNNTAFLPFAHKIIGEEVMGQKNVSLYPLANQVLNIPVLWRHFLDHQGLRIDTEFGPMIQSIRLESVNLVGDYFRGGGGSFWSKQRSFKDPLYENLDDIFNLKNRDKIDQYTPVSMRFSVTYTDHNNKNRQKSFDIKGNGQTTMGKGDPLQDQFWSVMHANKMAGQLPSEHAKKSDMMTWLNRFFIELDRDGSKGEVLITQTEWWEHIPLSLQGIMRPNGLLTRIKKPEKSQCPSCLRFRQLHYGHDGQVITSDPCQHCGHTDPHIVQYAAQYKMDWQDLSNYIARCFFPQKEQCEKRPIPDKLACLGYNRDEDISYFISRGTITNDMTIEFLKAQGKVYLFTLAPLQGVPDGTIDAWPLIKILSVTQENGIFCQIPSAKHPTLKSRRATKSRKNNNLRKNS